MPVQALERATQLILEICGGEPGPVVDVCADPSVLERPSVGLRRARIARVLGVTLDDADVTGILQRLGCQLEQTEAGWTVQPPHSRFDINIEEDLIEELARVHGYENIPAVLRPVPAKNLLPKETTNRLPGLRNALIANGYQEAVTYSFVDPEIEDILAPGSNEILLANPISAELARMRSTIWSGLIRAVQHNLNRQQSRVRLFELGPVFHKEEGVISQTTRISGVITGPLYPEQWGIAGRKADFYDLKGDVETLLAQASSQRFHFIPVAHPALHPGQSAEIATQTEVVGWMGVLHPRIEAKLGLEQSVYLFELNLDALLERKLPKYEAVTKFPSIRRDLALLVERSVLSSALDQAIAKVAPPQLVKWNVFDVYTGKGIEEHQKSVALSLILQDFSRTLEDNEVNRIVEAVIASLHSETGATLR